MKLDPLRKLHSLFQYPARLTVHLVDAVMRQYGGSFVDPFAGSGTVPVHGYLLGRPAEGFDLLPLVQLHTAAKVTVLERVTEPERVEDTLLSLEDEECDEDWVNKWWHPEARGLACSLIKAVRRHVWLDGCSVHSDFPELVLTALYALRRLSYADDTSYKWHTSKRKVRLIAELAERGKLRELYARAVRVKVNALSRLAASLPEPKRARVTVHGCVDVLTRKVKADVMLTSPPYLTSHEYVRSFKYELLALGVPTETVRKLSSLEVPYREVNCEWNGKVYGKYLGMFRGKRRRLFSSYFCALFTVIDNSDVGVVATVTGEPSLGGVRVPIHLILSEYLQSHGFHEVFTVRDTIRRRRAPWATSDAEVLVTYERNRDPTGYTCRNQQQ